MSANDPREMRGFSILQLSQTGPWGPQRISAEMRIAVDFLDIPGCHGILIPVQGGLPMKVSRTVSYALQATLQLAEAEADHPVPCSKLASEGKMPERFLLQILRNLVAHGVLESTRGVDGGYTLRQSPLNVSLLDIIEAVDGPMVSSLPVAEGLQEQCRQKLEELLTQVNDEARTRLASIRLSDLTCCDRAATASLAGDSSRS
jgi:Rrf2 family protein